MADLTAVVWRYRGYYIWASDAGGFYVCWTQSFRAPVESLGGYHWISESTLDVTKGALKFSTIKNAQAEIDRRVES